jgi:hypothetical protein
MAIDFPDSPSPGDQYTTNGKTYRWDGTVWGVYGTFSRDFTASDTEPTGVPDGHIWYRSDQSQTLIRYDNTWVEIGSAGGFDSSSTSFPTSLDSGTGFAAVEALQAKVGADGSAVTTSHDYKISQIESDISTAQSDISTAQSDISTAQSDITALENAAPQSGSIIQTQWTTLPVANFQTTASTIQNTGFSVTFTPQYASSKVLHILVIGAYFICDGQLKIYRGGSPAVNISLADSFRDVSTTAYIYDMPPTTVTLLDSPNTTSQITYEIWAYASGCGQTCYIGSPGDFTPTWLLMEVAA